MAFSFNAPGNSAAVAFSFNALGNSAAVVICVCLHLESTACSVQHRVQRLPSARNGYGTLRHINASITRGAVSQAGATMRAIGSSKRSMHMPGHRAGLSGAGRTVRASHAPKIGLSDKSTTY